ncbi:MAG: DsbA family protein [Pseudomonadota bacterium]|nr:DsbA family protein [Pseudomonadota bacterium]
MQAIGPLGHTHRVETGAENRPETTGETGNGRGVHAFIDLRSPYSCLAITPFRDAMRNAGARVTWHPFAIDIEATYGAPGSRSPREERKTKYLYMDVRRIAAGRGLVIRGPLRIYGAALAHMGLVFAREHGILDAYVDAIYARFFSRAIDIERPDEVAAAVAAAGGDAEAFLAYLDDQGPAELDRETRFAEELGVFGVPTFVRAGELFWGLDRIPLLASRIVAAD